MLGIVGDSGGVTVPPAAVDLIDAMVMSVGQLVRPHVDPRFLHDLARRGLGYHLAGILTVSDRLPESAHPPVP
jgi:hypothetical protein